jgi:glycosyltransferase involved in cell wall biosynthesis
MTNNTAGEPLLSLIMPCYNEEESIPHTIPRLLNAFERGGYRLELIAVDNGSSDRTGEIIRSLAAANPSVVPHRVEVNEGYGNGVLAAVPVCTAPWVGIIPADGQVDAEDVVRLFESVSTSNGFVLGKVRRRFRMDGLRRKIISICYNALICTMWPGLGSIDVNGSPKILPREMMLAMHLTSKNWLLDPEMVLKAHYMGLRIMEVNVFARLRGTGLSHVRLGTCRQFIWQLLNFRLTTGWRRNLPKVSPTVNRTPVWMSGQSTQSPRP